MSYETNNNEFGGCLYPTKSGMLRAIASAWLEEAGASAVFAEQRSDTVLVRELINGWEMKPHMQANGYSRADLVEAFAEYRAEVMAD